MVYYNDCYTTSYKKGHHSARRLQADERARVIGRGSHLPRDPAKQPALNPSEPARESVRQEVTMAVAIPIIVLVVVGVVTVSVLTGNRPGASTGSLTPATRKRDATAAPTYAEGFRVDATRDREPRGGLNSRGP